MSKVLLVALLAAGAIAAAGGVFAQGAGASAELDVVRHVQSSGLLPAAGEYVRYDVTVRNTGADPIEGQKLWVRFVSASEITGSAASFSIAYIAPGESRQFHLGPFKMPESGDYYLYLGINGDGRTGVAGSVDLNYLPDQSSDTITAYDPAVVTLVPVGAAIAAAGAALVVVGRRIAAAGKSQPEK